MTDPATETADPKAVRRVAALRLVTGLAQGLLLFGLDHALKTKAWPATQPAVFAAIAAVVIFVPFVVLAGLSAMRWSRLAAWKLVAVLVVAGLAAYAVHSGQAEIRPRSVIPEGVAMLAIAALLFIGHHLVQPAEMERRPIARFTTYFDETWKHGVQLALSALFTGAFWLLLHLASALFSMIGIEAINKLIDQPWFAWPATAVMFAAAVQLTDVRAGLVRGVRSVSLTLLAWLLPLMVLIAAGFLATLPFKGLDLLWATKKAAALLLTAAAFLIVLTNAAYQDGTEPPPKVLAWAARIAGLLLAPITVLAAYAIWLRVNQYGLTPERVYGAACVIVAAGYALGYAVAALKPGAWMKPLEPTNIALAFVSVAVLLGLFTPVADPVRLSVNSQLARLEAGKVKPEAFDYDFLRFDAGKRGEAALATLARDENPVIAREAGAAAKRVARRPFQPDKADLKRLPVYPAGRSLPESFVTGEQDPWLSYCGRRPETCSAGLVDIDGDGVEEVLVSTSATILIFKFDKGWKRFGRAAPACGDAKFDDLMKTGRFGVAPAAPRQDLLVGGRRLLIDPENDGCQDVAQGGSTNPVAVP
ncbi:hypothetical protein AS593_09025 [Caulobacter vibrioides]|nr:hypothetical protein AS593_09025 [Caulobacter vibrioides]